MNILLTSVGRRAYIIEYLRDVYRKLNLEGNIVAVNSDNYTTAMSAADKSFVSPLIYDNEYIPFLLNLCKRENIDILLSLFDIDLGILANSKKEFEKLGVEVIVSDKEIINICNDKLEMLKYLKSLGLNAAETFLDVNKAMEVCDFSKDTFILKPRWGMGSLNIYEAENEEELGLLYKKTLRNLKKSYLKFESQADINKAVLIQRKLWGEEYGLDILNDLRGNYICTTVKKKFAMRSGETDIAKIVENEELKALGEKIGKSLRHIGNLDMDVIFTQEGAYIIDMNARFGGGYPFTHAAGVNELEALIRWSLGYEVKNLQVKKYGLFAKEISIRELSSKADGEIYG